MIPAALGLAWAVLAVVAALRARPVPSRLPMPSPAAGDASVDESSGHTHGPLELLGRAVLHCGGALRRRRRHPEDRPDPPRRLCRRVGSLTLGCTAAAAISVPLALAVVLAGWVWPPMLARRAERRRLQRLEAALPEVVDLLALAVGAGANVTLAVAAVGRRGSGPLAAELARVTADVGRGRRVADALEEIPSRAGEATRPLAAALAASDRYGSPLGPALERLGDDVRRQSQRRAEEAARKVPVVLLFPLVLCVLPAFALLTVAPLVAGALRALRL